MVATDIVDELHETRVVMSWLGMVSVPSLKAPFAVNCWVSPIFEDTLLGDIVIVWRTRFFIVSWIDADTPDPVAVIVQVPDGATAVASPVADTVATDASDVIQTTDEDKSVVVAFE